MWIKSRYRKTEVFRLIVVCFVLFFYLPVQLFPAATVFAQEATPSADIKTPESSPSAAVQTTPTPEVTPTPETTLLPTLAPTIADIQPKEATSESNVGTPESSSLADPTPSAGISAMLRGSFQVERLAKRTYQTKDTLSLRVTQGRYTRFSVTVYDSDHHVAPIRMQQTLAGEDRVITIRAPAEIKPGKFTLEVSDDFGILSTQSFDWGVLALNPNKFRYNPGETADIAIAVLDEQGKIVCDADVSLAVTDPSGKTTSFTTKNGQVVVNPTCGSKSFTLIPDYEVTYPVGDVGTYKLTLSAITKNGDFSIDDTIEVSDSLPFSIERISATRLYPPLAYPMTVKVTASEDFTGTVTDVVPDEITVVKPEDSSVQGYDRVDTVPAGSLQNESALGPSFHLRLPYDTELAASNAGQLAEASGSAVLGANTYPVSQEFGDQVTDPILMRQYATYDLAGHDGIDFATPMGTPVVAVSDGTVLVAQENYDYGTTIIIDHSWGRSYYGHLSTLGVQEGQHVTQGEQIALSGDTGISTGPHLHFGIRANTFDAQNGYYGKIAPAPYLGLPSNSNVLGASSDLSQTLKVLTWDVSLKKGQSVTLGYQFTAPTESPAFYTLGPVRFFDGQNSLIYAEGRQWQLAVDAVPGQYTTTAQKVAPSAATGVSVTGSSSAWGNSSWGEVIASTTNAIVVTGVVVGGGTTSEFEIDIGKGTAGSETVVATISGDTESAASAPRWLMLPIPVDNIPASTRVAVRVRRSGTTTTAWVIATTPNSSLVVPSAAAGTSIAGSGSAWGNTGWTQVIASTGDAIALGGITINPGAAVEYEVDIGVGAASSEAVVTTIRGRSTTTGAPQTIILNPLLDNIASGTRVAVRFRKAGTSTTAWTFKLIYYNKTSLGVGASALTAKPLKWSPTAAAGASVTISGTAWANSSWVQLISSASTDLALAAVAFTPVPAADFEIEFGIGSAGNEVPIGLVRGRNLSTTLGNIYTMNILPLINSVPSSSRVAVRIRTSGTTTTAWTVSVGYYEDSDTTNLLDAPHQALPSAANSVTLTAAGVAWQNSSYGEMTSGLQNVAYITRVVAYPGATAQFEVDIATGASGSEVVQTTVAGQVVSATGNAVIDLPTPLQVSTNTRIAMRFRSSGTSGTGYFALEYAQGDAAPSAPTLYPDDGGVNQIAFNNIRQNDTTPIVRASATHTSTLNRFQVEFNNASDFTGIAYTETFSGTYSSGEANNLQTTASLNLPITDGVTYYVRAKASADEGSNYSSWSSGTWTYTYTSSAGNPEWFQTTDEQFDTGTLSSTQTSSSDSLQLAGTAQYVRANATAASLSTTLDTGTAGTNRLVAVFAFSEAEGATALSGVTVNTVACNLVAAALNNDATKNRTEFWYCDESDLGSLNGSQTITISGTGITAANWAVHAQLFTGISQSGPSDSGTDTTSLTPTTTTTVTGIDVPAGGIVVMGVSNGTQGLTATWPSPLTQKSDADPSSADAVTASGIETSLQTGKTYQVTWSSAPNRSSGVAASWAPVLASSGTIMSPVIDYNVLNGATGWGEVQWDETESPGTISVRVLGTTSTDCDTELISADTTSPTDLSGLDESGTGNRICLEATLIDSGGTPYLNDWTVTWASGGGGPTNDLLFRHGEWFSAGVKQPFTF
jgi:murein DD-endopeptidase MepM/ murein hydrolase activator NlpD